LQRLVYARSSEKSSTTPGQLLLELESETVEACHINEGQKVSSHTRHKAEKQKHPGPNQLPAHIPRKYVDMHPDNLPEDAELFDTIETEQLEYDPAKLLLRCTEGSSIRGTKLMAVQSSS
jgi:transposase